MIIDIDKTVELIEYQAKIFASTNKLSFVHVLAVMLIGAGIVLTEESRNL
jgi:tetrahydromethanopterin S-methyltransferase subunit F